MRFASAIGVSAFVFVLFVVLAAGPGGTVWPPASLAQSEPPPAPPPAPEPPYIEPPPAGYTAFDDNLISDKLARDFTSDPDEVRDGRFYDAGRNPEPISPPASPIPTEYGDYRFRVTHIVFDYKPDVPAGGGPPTYAYDEGLKMAHSRGEPLKHGKAPGGVVDLRGEWIYKYATTDTERGRSEPALYVINKDVKIKVRIECASPVAHAYVGAKEMRAPAPPGESSSSSWRDVSKTKVEFQDKIPNQLWVSKGAQISSGPEGPVFDEYVELPLSGATKGVIDRSDIVWQWYVDRILPLGTGASEWTAATVCAGNKDGWRINRSGSYETITIVDSEGNSQQVETVLPHKFYTVLEVPQEPWFSQAGHEPWANALDFALVQNDRILARGLAAREAVAAKVTTYVYKGHPLRYDHVYGETHFMDFGQFGSGGFLQPNAEKGTLLLTDWIGLAPGGGMEVNCLDQAAVLLAMINLLGGDSKMFEVEPFGYVKPSDFVGDADLPALPSNNCNNPFFKMTSIYVGDALVGGDDTFWRFVGEPQVRKRSAFLRHFWVELNIDGNVLVYDATLGPANSNAPYAGLTRAAYKTAAIDLSNVAESPWEDNERMAHRVNGEPAKTESGDLPDPNYQFGEMSKAVPRSVTLH